MARTILLLDDEPFILMGLDAAAESRGLNVLLASNCGEALDLIESAGPIHAAVLDFNLGEGHNCTSVAQELSDQMIPFVLHSADMHHSQGTPMLGGALQVPKPTAPDTVIAAALALVPADHPA